jgi:hypothetical protein
VAPLAALPGILHAPIPGVSLASAFSGAGPATAIGLGVAVSTAGVMFCEYLALSRLLHAIGGWTMRRVMLGIGLVVVAAAPFSLGNPDSFFSALVKPSLVALWVSQLIVVAVYPRFARRQHRALAPALILSLAASGLLIYGLWTSLQTVTS